MIESPRLHTILHRRLGSPAHLRGDGACETTRKQGGDMFTISSGQAVPQSFNDAVLVERAYRMREARGKKSEEIAILGA